MPCEKAFNVVDKLHMPFFSMASARAGKDSGGAVYLPKRLAEFPEKG
jgi:hypothetical protein